MPWHFGEGVIVGGGLFEEGGDISGACDSYLLVILLLLRGSKVCNGMVCYINTTLFE